MSAVDAANQPRTSQAERGLYRRFPALRRLRWSRRPPRRVPLIQQLSEVDCGPACLAMVLALHGKHVPISVLRQDLGTSDRDGTSLTAIIAAARRHGLHGRGVRVEPEGLYRLPIGTILYWEFRHFVVLERADADGIEIVDPGGGRRRVPMRQVKRVFTGVAATFEPTNTFERGGQRPPSLWHHLGAVLGGSGLLSRILAVSLLIQLLSLALPVLTATVVDRVLPRGDQRLLEALALGLAVLVAFQLLSSLLRSHLLLHLSTRIDLRMTLGFVSHLVRLPFAFFQSRPAGDLIMRMNSNATVRELVTTSALSGLLDGTLVSLYLVVLLVASAKMALLVAGLAALQVGVYLLTRRRQRELMARNLETQARASSYQVEMLTAIETLKSMGAEQQAVQRWSNLFVDDLNVVLARGRLDAACTSIRTTLQMASPLLILGYGAHLVLGEQLSLGTMLAVSALAQGFLAPLSTLVGTATRLELLGGYLDRINDIMQAEPEQPDDGKLARPARLRGEVALDRVSFGYAPTSPPVVREVTLSVTAGQHVAVVGPTGSGKSTLARLLVGLYQPRSGRILFDGTDLSQLDCQAVRAQLGIVTQSPELFSGSIRDNIAQAVPGASLDQIVAAAKRAAIHEEILAMPMGYETVLADRGLSLSGGQRQRIALARALLRQPALLLLDEATSALDAETEQRVQQELSRMRCTRISIAHRLSTIKDADVIIVITDGQVVEQGTYQQLARADGVFAGLVARQAA